MRIEIPDGLSKKDTLKFLVENKSRFIAQKKSIIKYTDNTISDPEIIRVAIKDAADKTAGGAPADLPDGQVWVKIVGNACWWCDDQMDVLIDDSAKKTIEQRKGLIPHLPDHTHKLEAQVGDVQDVYLEAVSLRKLGLNKTGSTQCIVMESLVRKDYNPRVYELYKSKKVNQHSIGLQYVRIELAVNDPEWEKEMDFWNKYIDKVINKAYVEEKGFFWVVSEIKLLEISGVLFGSNELTPSLEVGKDGHLDQTAEEASGKESATNKDFDLDVAIRLTKFNFN